MDRHGRFRTDLQPQVESPMGRWCKHMSDAGGGSSKLFCFFFQAEEGIRDPLVTGVQTCALPIFGATWNGLRWWRLWEQTTVTRPAKMRRKERGLSFELVDRAVDVWFPFPNAHVAGKVARWQIIGTIDYDVVIANQLDGIAPAQACGVGLDCDRCIDGKQTCARRIGFLAANVARSMQELPVKVAEINRVLIDNSDRSNSGGGEVKRRGRSEPAGPNTQHPGFFQSTLTFLTYLSKIDLPRVSEELVGA